MAQTLADAATIGILQQRTVRRSEVAAAQLHASLTSRIAIEQAKGVLAERLQISADDAFEVLRRAARSRNLLSELSRDVASGSPDVAQLLLVMFADASVQRNSQRKAAHRGTPLRRLACRQTGTRRRPTVTAVGSPAAGSGSPGLRRLARRLQRQAGPWWLVDELYNYDSRESQARRAPGDGDVTRAWSRDAAPAGCRPWSAGTPAD